MNMFSPPFYLNDTIQDELDNYSYHASFENNQAELNYANNFLVLNEEADLPQLGLTPKKWFNQQNSLNHRTTVTANQFASQQAVQTGGHPTAERKAIHARRYLPFTSLAERNTQSVATGAVGTTALLANPSFIRKRTNIDNLRIIRHNSNYLSHDANRPKDAAVGSFVLML